MRVGRLLVALVAGAVAAGSMASLAPAVQAAGAPISVDGHGDIVASGLARIDEDCTGSRTPPAVQLWSTRGGTLGTHALGWEPATGFEAGVWAYSADPSPLSTLAADVLPTLGSTSGHVVARYYDTADETAGYWYGYAPINPAGEGWLSVDAVDEQLTW